MIPQIVLTEEDKKRLSKIMCEGNKPLKYWHNRVSKKGYKAGSRFDFRNKLLKIWSAIDSSSENEIKALLKCESVDWADRTKGICIAGLKIPARTMEKIYAVKQIEQDLIFGNAGVIGEAVSKWGKWGKTNNGINEFDDLFNEGILRCIRASVYYTNKNIAFTTFLTVAIQRHMISICTKDHFLNAPFETHSLAHSFKTVKDSFNRPVTFEEVVEKMGLGKKQIQSLISALNAASQPISLREQRSDETTITPPAARLNGINIDYVIKGHNHGIPIYSPDETHIDLLLYKAIETANLSDWERYVFEAKAKGDTLQQIAFTHVHPDTNKPVTRMAIQLVLNKARTKIKKLYDHFKRNSAAA